MGAMGSNETRTRWTWAEFCRLPSEGSTRYEVIDGELYVTPGPAPGHQRIVTKLITTLDPFLRERELGELLPGPVDVIFAEGDYLEPDLVFVGRQKAELVSDRGIEGPPDLVVEILSPSTLARDRGIKLERYRLFGVPEYWVVDPDGGSVEVWRLAAGTEEAAVYGAGQRFGWTPAGAGADGGEVPTLEVEVDRLV